MGKVKLENLAIGAANERFDEELKKVIPNIMDPNTTDAAREIKLTVKIKPLDPVDRRVCGVSISCSSKLAPLSPVITSIHVGMKDNEYQAYENNPDQIDLFDTNQPENAVELPVDKEAVK